MMSTTYESILERSVLEWRVDFARLILKIELECEWLTTPPKYLCGLVKPWDLHAGQCTPDGKRYLFYFKNVGSNIEGVEMEGGSEIFGDGLDNFQPPHLAAPLPQSRNTLRETSVLREEARERRNSRAASPMSHRQGSPSGDMAIAARAGTMGSHGGAPTDIPMSQRPPLPPLETTHEAKIVTVPEE